MRTQRALMVSWLACSVYACSNGYEYQPSESRQQTTRTIGENARQVEEDDTRDEVIVEVPVENVIIEENVSTPPSEAPPAPVELDNQALMAEQGQMFFAERGCAAAFCHNQNPTNDNRLVNKIATQILAAMNNPRHANLVNNNLWPNDLQAMQLAAFFASP